MGCVQDVFGADGANVPPQTLQNAPILDIGHTAAQVTAIAGGGTPAIGTASVDPQPRGTVYLASDWYFQPGASIVPIFAGYAHELANLLDMKMNPPGTTDGQQYGYTYGNPNDLTVPLDADTGRQVEICMFGSPQYPPHP